MTLSEFKNHLQTVEDLRFLKPEGTAIPAHFHITEVGQIDKKFIDCGGMVRSEQVVSMQLWESDDVWHRLAPQKLEAIISLSEQKLGIGNHEIELEYQGETIGKFGIEFENGHFQLISKSTKCLASDSCGIPALTIFAEKLNVCCSPSSSCC